MSAVPKSNYTESIAREMGEWVDVSEWWFEKRAKHNAVVIRVGAYEQFQIFPASGSDSRGHLNALSDLRALLRRMGATPIERTKAGPKEHRPPPPPVEVKAPAISDPRPDGFAPLAALRTGLVKNALARWDEVRVNQERIEDAAHALIGAWHPELILRAADLIRGVRNDR